MKILVTGTPGSGKTTLAKGLGKYLSYNVINEKDFALKNKLGTFNDDNELELPLVSLEKKLNSFLSKKDNIIIEGHVLCELKLKVDKVILITINPEELEMRLEQRGYSGEKIMDNVFCEGIEYCKKHVQKRYDKNKIVEVKSSQNSKNTLFNALKLLKLLKKA